MVNKLGKVPNSGAGRPKGAQNKLSASAKENIAAVFIRLGGTAAMAEWASENKTAYYAIYSKLLPHEVTGEGGGPVQIVATSLDERI